MNLIYLESIKGSHMTKKIAILLCLTIVFGCGAFQKKSEYDDENVKYLNVGTLVEEKPVNIPDRPEIAEPEMKQRKRINKFVPASEMSSGSPDKAIEKAKKDATEVATDDKFVNAITVYNFSEGMLYEIYTSPNKTTDIMFQKGEEICDVGAGDTERWGIDQTFSGSGADKRLHLFVKPKKAGLHTNFVIPTTKRTYHLELRSYKDVYQTGVSWNYPKEEFENQVARIKGEKVKEDNEVNNLDLLNMNFDYEIIGSANWKPVRVFDDGNKTFIKFPEKIANDELPPLFLVSRENKTQLVNYRFKMGYYIVDRVFDAAVLKMGEKRQDKVFIYKDTAEGAQRRILREGRFSHAE